MTEAYRRRRRQKHRKHYISLNRCALFTGGISRDRVRREISQLFYIIGAESRTVRESALSGLKF